MILSFIIPVYNIGLELNDCIASILKDKSGNNEIIIVNDGSDTKTAKRLMNIARLHDSIIVINQENGGVSSARNTGIKHAKGEYLCFIDGDDQVSEDYIFQVKNKIATDSPDIIQIGFKRILKDKFYKCIPYTNNTYNDIEQYFANERFTHAVWSYVIKRDIVIANNLIFNNKLKYSEDQEFLLKLFCLIQSVSVINKVLYLYIDRQESAVNHKASFERAAAQLEAANNIISFIGSKNKPSNIHKKSVKRLVDDYFFYCNRLAPGFSLEIKNYFLEYLKKVNRNDINKNFHLPRAESNFSYWIAFKGALFRHKLRNWYNTINSKLNKKILI